MNVVRRQLARSATLDDRLGLQTRATERCGVPGVDVAFRAVVGIEWTRCERNGDLGRLEARRTSTATADSVLHVAEPAVVALECDRDISGRAVAMLGDDHVGLAGAFGVAVVEVGPVE